jgi:hypothetical protein
MSRTISPLSGKPYGLALVCRTWRVPRATVYRRRVPQQASAPQRSGPVGRWPMRRCWSTSAPSSPPARSMARGASQGLGAAADRRDPDFGAARAASDA